MSQFEYINSKQIRKINTYAISGMKLKLLYKGHFKTGLPLSSDIKLRRTEKLDEVFENFLRRLWQFFKLNLRSFEETV